jgi:hypothetical protein
VDRVDPPRLLGSGTFLIPGATASELSIHSRFVVFASCLLTHPTEQSTPHRCSANDPEKPNFNPTIALRSVAARRTVLPVASRAGR